MAEASIALRCQQATRCGQKGFLEETAPELHFTGHENSKAWA